jgi:putative peptidoglycan lipid II flippase
VRLKGSGRNVLVNFSSRVLLAVLNVGQLVLVARVFGASAATDAYLIASWTPTLFWSLAETVLISSFVPFIVNVGVTRGVEAARRSADEVFTWTLIVLALSALFVFAAAPLLALASAPGFDEATRTLTVRMMRLFSPAILLAGTTSFLSSVSYAERRFAAPALAQLIPGAAVVACLLIGRSRWGIESVVMVFTAGVALQLVVVALVLRKQGLLPRLRMSPLSAHAELLRLVAPRVGANAANQGMAGVDRLFASTMSLGSVSVLVYAYRLARLAPKLITASLGRTMIPTLSRTAAEGDNDAIRDFVPRYMGLILFVLAPIAVATIYYRLPLIRLFFQRGQFSAEAAQLTADIFVFYMIAVLLQTVRMSLNGVFAATRDNAAPFRIALIGLALDAPLNYLFSLVWGLAGIAISTMAISAFGLVQMLYVLNKKLGRIPFGPAYRAVARVVPATAVMSLALWGIDSALRPLSGGGGAFSRLAVMALAAGAAGVLYLAVCWGLRLRRVLAIKATARTREPGAPETRIIDGGMDDGF